jgi:tetratricopeptide (TPR) repeat protein
MHCRSIWAFVGVLLLGSSATLAQPASPDPEAERTAVYEEGVKLADAGRWAEAAQKFERALAIRPAPRVRFSLGQAQEKSGKLATAKATYAVALAEAQATADETAAGAAGGALAAIERRVPRIMLRIPSDVPNAQVSVDDAAVTLSRGTVEVDPGERRLAVRAPGRRAFEQTVSASEGRTVDVTVRLDPEQSAGPATATTGGTDAARPDAAGAAAPRTETSGPPAGVWVLGATGIVAAAVGVALYATGSSAYDDAAELCTDARCSDASAADDGNAARVRMIAGDVVIGVGAAALAGALLWWAVAPSPAATAEPAQTQVGVAVTPSGFGVTLRTTL